MYPANDYIKTPMEYFLMFFSEEVFELIVEQTNLYSCQKFSKSVDTSVKVINVINGYRKIPAYSNYWSPSTRNEQISNVMSLERYKQLIRCLHFCNNEDNEDADCFFKFAVLLILFVKIIFRYPKENDFPLMKLWCLIKKK